MVQFRCSKVGGKLMRLLVFSVAVLLAIIFSGSVLGASSLDSDTMRKLSQLEKRYFGRSFDSDADDSRVARVEKYVFGAPVAGTPQQRIENLFSATVTATDMSRDVKSAKSELNSSPVHSPSTPGAKSQSTAQNPVSPASNDAFDTYPHITALENAILGQSYSSQPLSGRLERMEMRAFGSASANLDFSQRTDALDDYAARQLHKEHVQNDAESETASSADSEPIQNQADYPHVTALEKAILSQTFVGEPLADRLSRMEIKAFGSASSNSDLSQRTDALERYAEKKLHKKAPDEQTTDTASSNGQGSKAPKLLSMLGQGVLGLAGLGGGGLGGMGSGGMGSGGMGLGGMGMGMGRGGMGFGGMGMGMGPGGMGFGGMRRQQAAQSAQQQPTPEAETRRDDPQVYDPTPPPPNAKMLTKVGWCEMQVFGHTFPNMHLPERLGRLSREVNFEPGKPDVALMDDIAPLIKTIQARKQTGQALGSGMQPAAR
jgi:hypothetical protein